MLTVAEMTSLFSWHNRHTWGSGPPPLSRLAAERKEKKKAGQSLTDTTANSQSTVVMDATLRFLFARTSRLSPYCHCSDHYPVPSVAHTSLRCAKNVTDSGSIRGRCSINYTQFIKLHRTKVRFRYDGAIFLF